MRNIERPERPVFHLVAYKLHASFFQAVDLPVHRTTMPSPFVLVSSIYSYRCI